MVARFCRSCGVPADVEARFCASCGGALAIPDASAPIGLPPVVQVANSRRRLAVAVGVVAALVAGAVAAVVFTSDGSSADGVASTSPTTDDPTTTSVVEDLSDSDLVRRFGDAVWRVEVDGCGVVGSGSAFAIAPNLLVTNHHVVAVDPTPVLRSRTGKTIAGQVVGMSASPDVALIRVEEDLEPTLAWADPTNLSEGDHLLGLGYPVPAMDFSATPGSILSFQVTSGQREAIRTDSALDRGNSGGPALNDSGEVVGVVTEMAASDGFQNVPLVFTQDALGSTVQGWEEKTTVVAADCAVLEPPPLPDWYVTDDVALPPIDGPDYPEYEVPEFEMPTTTTVPCPSGRPSAAVTEFDAVEQDPDFLAGWYEVTIRGSITNNASGSVNVYAVDVAVGASYPAMGIPQTMTLRPGQTTSWDASTLDEFSGQPSAGKVTLQWDWSSIDHFGCGTG